MGKLHCISCICSLIGWSCALVALTMDNNWGDFVIPSHSAAITFGGVCILTVVLLGWPCCMCSGYAAIYPPDSLHGSSIVSTYGYFLCVAYFFAFIACLCWFATYYAAEFFHKLGVKGWHAAGSLNQQGAVIAAVLFYLNASIFAFCAARGLLLHGVDERTKLNSHV